jgi:hypothetical protein
MGKSSVEDTMIEESFGDKRGAHARICRNLLTITSSFMRAGAVPPVSYGESR